MKTLFIVLLVLLLAVTVVAAFVPKPIEIKCIDLQRTANNGIIEYLDVKSQRVNDKGIVICKYYYRRNYPLQNGG